MICTKCRSADLRRFTAEVAIHFPGMEGLDKPIVWVFPKLMVCVGCGGTEFVIPGEPLSKLRNEGPGAAKKE